MTSSSLAIKSSLFACSPDDQVDHEKRLFKQRCEGAEPLALGPHSNQIVPDKVQAHTIFWFHRQAFQR